MVVQSAEPQGSVTPVLPGWEIDNPSGNIYFQLLPLPVVYIAGLEQAVPYCIMFAFMV
jgi:hypothetical protein